MPGEAPPELIQRAIRDRAAFGELYDLYLGRVYAFCRKHSDTREDAEDLTVQTFEKALAAIGRYEERGQPFSAWLLRIAANTIIDTARRSRVVMIPQEELVRLQSDSFLQEWEEAYWLHMHISTLSPDQREAIRLRFFEDRPFAGVAQEMGRSEGAVKQLVRRALRALHLRITAEMEEDSNDG
jgi:RNA polymerase sigma-70 factor (ECF subfamily)